ALHLGTPASVIEAAVAARNVSALKHRRIDGERQFGAAAQPIGQDGITIADLEGALVAGKIICYAQGFDLLDAAGREFGWSLPMAAIAEVWREGCIIRSAMLNDMASALRSSPDRNLMFAPYFSDLLGSQVPALRRVTSRALAAGHQVPALAAALCYFDSMRTARSTANLIQGQRDFFGAHGFERVDRDGKGYHGPWGSRG
ncbi:MAG: NADP-dependent phosphogluconate dehydrogenase, partial [Rhodospirillaceae bacterium]|nr:NADP-dependent phosphogluconate dehydrogenase [Rhodospirillaceae bacterium]